MDGLEKADTARRRSGSNRRIRQGVVGVRLSPDERAVLDQLATEAGMPVAEWLRRAGLMQRLAAKRQKANGPGGRALQAVMSELGRIGNNLNQVARHLNTAARAGVPAAPDEASLHAAAEALDRVRGDVLEALGRPGIGKPPP